MFNAHFGDGTPYIQSEKDLQELLKIIEKNFLVMSENLKTTREALKKTKEETYKDEELKNLQNEINNLKKDLVRGYSISEEEAASAKKWETAHRLLWHPGSKKYLLTVDEFVGTEVGVFGTRICSCCRKNNPHAYNTLEYKKYMKTHGAEFDFKQP